MLGALLGRLLGALVWKTAGSYDRAAVWADPGVWAVLGSASVFSGVTRLTISLTVILYESLSRPASLLFFLRAATTARRITDDVALMLPIMFAAVWIPTTGSDRTDEPRNSSS